MSQVEDVSAPEGWTPTTLGALGRYLNGRAFKKVEWARSGRPIIRIQDLTGSNLNPNFYEGQVEDRYVVRPGDFLISWAATLGAYIWDGPEGVLNQHIFKVVSGIDRRFHYHLARHKLYELQAQAHGSGMVHITKDLFDSTPVAVPQPHVQARVARAIDETESRIDAGKAHVANAKRAIDRLRGTILAAACTGRLTTDWRMQHPEVQTVEAALARVPRKVRRHNNEDPVDLELPDLPATYVVAPLGHTAILIDYGTSQPLEDIEIKGVPVLRMGNIQDGQLDWTDLKGATSDRGVRHLLLKDGDLLFNRTNSPELVGKSAVFHGDTVASFASYLIRVRFAQEVADPDYVNLWLESAWGRAWARLAKTDGVSQSNINSAKLSLMPLPLPPIEEQEAIVRRAKETLTLADRLHDRAVSVSKTLDTTMQAVLAKAFRAELTIDGGEGRPTTE